MVSTRFDKLGVATVFIILILGSRFEVCSFAETSSATSTEPAKLSANNNTSTSVNQTTAAVGAGATGVVQQPNSTFSSNDSGTGRTNDSSVLPRDPSSDGDKSNGILGFIRDRNGAIMRAFYVMLGVTGIVVLYFVIRSFRLRRRRSKSRKYGIIAKKGDLEMTPLDQDEDDEDMTVFEASNHLRR